MNNRDSKPNNASKRLRTASNMLFIGYAYSFIASLIFSSVLMIYAVCVWVLIMYVSLTDQEFVLINYISVEYRPLYWLLLMLGALFVLCATTLTLWWAHAIVNKRSKTP